jgi:hypothetical protein
MLSNSKIGKVFLYSTYHGNILYEFHLMKYLVFDFKTYLLL